MEPRKNKLNACVHIETIKLDVCVHIGLTKLDACVHIDDRVENILYLIQNILYTECGRFKW